MEIARDFEGIRIAAGEMMAEEMMVPHRARIKRQMEGASPENLEHALAATVVTRTLAPAYYNTAQHLFFLEHSLVAPIFLQAVEQHGLAAIADARHRFDAEHPQCRCGMRMIFHDSPCANCGFDPMKAKAA